MWPSSATPEARAASSIESQPTNPNPSHSVAVVDSGAGNSIGCKRGASTIDSSTSNPVCKRRMTLSTRISEEGPGVPGTEQSRTSNDQSRPTSSRRAQTASAGVARSTSTARSRPGEFVFSIRAEEKDKPISTLDGRSMARYTKGKAKSRTAAAPQAQATPSHLVSHSPAPQPPPHPPSAQPQHPQAASRARTFGQAGVLPQDASHTSPRGGFQPGPYAPRMNFNFQGSGPWPPLTQANARPYPQHVGPQFPIASFSTSFNYNTGSFGHPQLSRHMYNHLPIAPSAQDIYRSQVYNAYPTLPFSLGIPYRAAFDPSHLDRPFAAQSSNKLEASALASPSPQQAFSAPSSEFDLQGDTIDAWEPLDTHEPPPTAPSSSASPAGPSIGYTEQASQAQAPAIHGRPPFSDCHLTYLDPATVLRQRNFGRPGTDADATATRPVQQDVVDAVFKLLMSYPDIRALIVGPALDDVVRAPSTQVSPTSSGTSSHGSVETAESDAELVTPVSAEGTAPKNASEAFDPYWFLVDPVGDPK